MQICSKRTTTTKIHSMTVLILCAFAISLIGSTAHAADATWLAHRAIRQKLLREAGDRSDVRFLSTHVDRLQKGLRTVTGKGRFRRRGKPGQNFTYHTTVNIYNNSDKDTGYDLRP